MIEIDACGAVKSSLLLSNFFKPPNMCYVVTIQAQWDSYKNYNSINEQSSAA
jgi:hypothetical protein